MGPGPPIDAVAVTQVPEDDHRTRQAGRRRRRRRRRWALALVAVIIAVLTTSALFFVWPATAVPRHADAIVVLNGGGPRLQEGVALASAGVAPWLVVSVSSTGWLCPPPIPHVHIDCFEPHPATTQGEARFAGKLARQHHWRRMVVVASTPQVSRARLRVERCYSGTIDMVGVSPGGIGRWLYGIVYEWGASFKAIVLQPSC